MTQQARKSSRTKRGALKPGVGTERGMPTEEDIRYLEQTRLPAVEERRGLRGVGVLFTPEVCNTLEEAPVAGYFGTRVANGHLPVLARKTARAEAVRDRMDHGAAIAAQIAAPLAADLSEAVGELMRDWEGFAVRFPQAADRLMPLRNWWESIHRGGTRPARNDTPSPEPTPEPAPAPLPKPA